MTAPRTAAIPEPQSGAGIVSCSLRPVPCPQAVRRSNDSFFLSMVQGFCLPLRPYSPRPTAS